MQNTLGLHFSNDCQNIVVFGFLFILSKLNCKQCPVYIELQKKLNAEIKRK